MALSQEERISISKKVIDIPRENAGADGITATLEDSKAKAQLEDNGNKKLMDDITAILNEYQNELTLLNGSVRRELTEQDMIDASNKKLQNDFFPNNLSVALPSVPNGIWKQFTPFSGNLAIGKTYTETYPTTTKEQDIIDLINPIISTLETRDTLTERTTGQECIEGDPDAGSCAGETPPGSGTTEALCLANGGVWTPNPTSDSINPKALTQADMIALKDEIQNWETHLNSEKAAIQAADAFDTNTTRNVQNAIAIADIDTAISIIDAWQALPDFYTGHSAVDCDDFDNLDPSTFPATKLAIADLQALKDEIADRTAFQTTRSAELISDTYLGGISQDLNSGEIVSATGLYGTRFRIIDMRLNLMAGSLNKVFGLEKGQAAQEELKNSNGSAAIALASVISASAFRAPASGTSTIHVLDGSLFSVSDSAYVVANTQEEISVTILGVSGNTIFLDKKIPKKYRQNDGARLYKVL